MTAKKSNILRLLLFLFGFSQFFVKIEPGPAELILLPLILYTKTKALTHPVTISLFAGNLIALSLETFIFGSASWSITSIYLTLCFVVVLSSLYRIGLEAYKAIIIGGCFACITTLAILITTKSPDLYKYGIRFTGFFKDPNVTAPTALFFGIAALFLSGRSKFLAIFPLIIFAIAISRASYIALACATLITASIGSPVRTYLAIASVSMLTILKDYIIAIANTFFSAIGRGGIVNSYDNDRSSNWISLVSNWSSQILPLAPTYSEQNGYATHSTPLRLLVEQGVISTTLFFFACFLATKSTQPRLLLLALLSLIINGIVVDATHWRVLFIALAISIGAAYLKSNMLPHSGHSKNY